MYRLWILTGWMFCAAGSNAQDISGYWYSQTNSRDGLFKILLQIVKHDNNYSVHYRTSLFDERILKVDSVWFANKVLYLGNQKRELFRGMLFNDSVFKGRIYIDKYYATELKRVKKPPGLAKPQTPHPPFPYQSRLIAYYNPAAHIRITGVLTLPGDTTKKRPAIILLSGSGKNDRDYTFGSHKPFALLADFLTKRGFIVLRTNDRGINGTEGIFENTTLADFVSDTKAAIQFLANQKEVDTSQIGILGHSEGGMVAPLVAAEDARIKYIISLAGPVLPFKDIILQQLIDIPDYTAKSFEDVKNMVRTFYRKAYDLKEKYSDTSEYRKAFYALAQKSLKGINMSTVNSGFKVFISNVTSNRYEFLKDYDPKITLQNVKVPVLGLYCGKDMLVNGPINSTALQHIIAGKNDGSKVVLLPGLNHNFQHCKKCDLNEPLFLEETFSPGALSIIGNWLKQITGKQ